MQGGEGELLVHAYKRLTVNDERWEVNGERKTALLYEERSAATKTKDEKDEILN